MGGGVGGLVGDMHGRGMCMAGGHVWQGACGCAGADPGFCQGGAPASEAESCQCSKAESCEQSEPLAAGVQGPLKGPGSFWVFTAQICILLHSRGSFSLISDR